MAVDKDEIKKQIDGLTKTMRALAKPAFDLAVFLLPHIIQLVQTIYKYYMKLPQNAINFMLGFVYCFFGGTFPVLFASIQAAEHGGRMKVMQSLEVLSKEAMIIIEETKKDDDKDEDGDGVADVKQISGQELLTRKTLLVLRKMDPEKIDKALSDMYTVWVSVAAVLSIQFARTVSMALSIAEFLKKPCDRFVAPILERLIPDEYDKWVKVILQWITQAVAMSLAWYIQSILSATTSALKGGLIMAHSVYHAMQIRGINLFGALPENHEDTAVDEILSYGFAAWGFYVQFRNNFQLPAPLNLILFPFTMAEQYIRWTVTYGNKGAPQ